MILYVQNLKNPDYVDLVAGSIENLPAKLAERGKCAGSFSRWAKQQNVRNVDRIARKVLRKNNFINDLVEICHNPCDMN